VPSLIIGIAGNRLRISAVLPVAVVVPVVAVRIPVNCVLIPVVPVFADREVRPASVIHPNAPFIRSPTVAFGTSGVAVLRRQAHSAPYIHRAGVSSHIVGVAGNRGLAL